MDQRNSQKFTGSETRRDFLKKSAAVVAGGQILSPPIYAQGGQSSVSIVTDPSDPALSQPPVRRALEQLQQALKAKGASSQIHQAIDNTSAEDEVILVARRGSALSRPLLDDAGMSVSGAPESVGLVRGQAGNRPALLVSGSDARGLVYGLLEVADSVTHATGALAGDRRPSGGKPSSQSQIEGRRHERAVFPAVGHRRGRAERTGALLRPKTPGGRGLRAL